MASAASATQQKGEKKRERERDGEMERARDRRDREVGRVGGLKGSFVKEQASNVGDGAPFRSGLAGNWGKQVGLTPLGMTNDDWPS